MTEASIHYKVERTKRDSRWYPVARWDWLYSPGYWWFAPDHAWYPGWNRWGCLGPIPPWWNWNPDPPEIVVEGDAKIGPDGTFLVDIDTAAALANHSDSDHNYSITAEVVDQSRRTIIGTGQVLVAENRSRSSSGPIAATIELAQQLKSAYRLEPPTGNPSKDPARPFCTLFVMNPISRLRRRCSRGMWRQTLKALRI